MCGAVRCFFYYFVCQWICSDEPSNGSLSVDIGNIVRSLNLMNGKAANSLYVLSHVSSFLNVAHSICERLCVRACACVALYTFMSNIYTSNGCNAVGDKIIGAY